MSNNWRADPEINDQLVSFEQQTNNISDKNIATYANIDPLKFAGAIITGREVAGTEPAQILRLDQAGNWRPPFQVGNYNNKEYIKAIKSFGALQFYADSTPAAHVVSVGWFNGAASLDVPCSSITLEFNQLLSYWTISIDSLAAAYVDPLNTAGVFINTLPSGARSASLGASIHFNRTDKRIDWRNNGNVIGYIDSTGTHEV